MLSAETLQQIAASTASAGPLNESVLDSLRQSWPELRFTLCNDDDMPARLRPAVQADGFNLYMVGGGEHCLSLTTDHDQAVGVVLAQVDEY